MQLPTPLESYNHTELYQTAVRAGLNISPRMTRDELINSLIGDSIPVQQSVIDSWREGLIGFLAEYWATLEPQLKCPAKNLKKGNPRPCYGCLDMQVIACIEQNEPSVQRLIALHRK